MGKVIISCKMYAHTGRMARRADAIGSLRFSLRPNLRELLDSGLQSPPFCAQPSVSVMIAVFLAALESCTGRHIFQVASHTGYLKV